MDVARDHQSRHAEHRVDSVPVAGAAGALSADFHPVFRKRWLVPALVPARAVRSAARLLRMGTAIERRHARHQDRGAAVPDRALRVLHVLSRRARKNAAGAALSDALLPDDLAWRRAWRHVRWPDRAAHLPDLLRARPGLRGGRDTRHDNAT